MTESIRRRRSKEGVGEAPSEIRALHGGRQGAPKSIPTGQSKPSKLQLLPFPAILRGKVQFIVRATVLIELAEGHHCDTWSTVAGYTGISQASSKQVQLEVYP